MVCTMLLKFEGSRKTQMESLIQLAPCKTNPSLKVDLLLPRQAPQHSSAQGHLQAKVITPSPKENGPRGAATCLAMQVSWQRLHAPSHTLYFSLHIRRMTSGRRAATCLVAWADHTALSEGQNKWPELFAGKVALRP